MVELQIKADAISYTYGGTDINRPPPTSFKFNLSDGLLNVSGANGVGKSTLLAMVIGELEPTRGSVWRSPKMRNKTAVLFQRDGLIPNISVRENLIAAGVDVSALKTAIRQYNLEELLHQSAKSLSGGEERRVQMVRCAFSNKALWILDEPTSSLDQETADLFASECVNHIRRGGGIILVTHDLKWLEGLKCPLTEQKKYQMLSL